MAELSRAAPVPIGPMPAKLKLSNRKHSRFRRETSEASFAQAEHSCSANLLCKTLPSFPLGELLGGDRLNRGRDFIELDCAARQRRDRNGFHLRQLNRTLRCRGLRKALPRGLRHHAESENAKTENSPNASHVPHDVLPQYSAHQTNGGI
jgi:hypothetical protein